MYLLSRFCERVRNRSLRHYFIPKFNLFSVKLTDQPRKERLRIFDIILQSDIRVIKKCKSLKNVWAQLLSHDAGINVFSHTLKRNFLQNDECIMNAIDLLHNALLKWIKDDLYILFEKINQITSRNYHTPLLSFVIGLSLTETSILLVCFPSQSRGNTIVYRSHRFLKSNVSGIDISTCKLRYAMLMTKHGDYRSSLRIVKSVLSSISQFALYFTGGSLSCNSEETKRRYIDMFIDNDTPVTERAKRAWMFDLRIMPADFEMVTTAIQVELIYCDEEYGLFLSPFVCVYYLLFLNYSGLRQYDNRDRALRHLIDVVNDLGQCGSVTFHSYNIGGHCLLSVGDIIQARDMFMWSYMDTLLQPAYHRFNSAQYYLQCMSHNA